MGQQNSYVKLYITVLLPHRSLGILWGMQMNIYSYASKHEELLNQLPGFVQLNDLDSKLAFVNVKVAKLIGFNNAHDVAGIHYYDMKCKASDDHEILEKQDTMVFSRSKKISVFCYHYYHTGWSLLLYEKSPIFDKNQKLIGLITYGTDITNYNLIDYSRFIFEHSKYFPQNKKRFSYIIEDGTVNNFNLSERQTACLFFLLRGKSDKEIGKILNLSPRTVESYINEIKHKMDCLTRTQVIEKSIHEGLINMIPSGFFKEEKVYK